jgi:hypothetical protein
MFLKVKIENLVYFLIYKLFKNKFFFKKTIRKKSNNINLYLHPPFNEEKIFILFSKKQFYLILRFYDYGNLTETCIFCEHKCVLCH